MITNPQVMIVIPEQIDVTMRKAIFWSVTGRVAGWAAVAAAASMLDILGGVIEECLVPYISSLPPTYTIINWPSKRPIIVKINYQVIKYELIFPIQS
jgi:hypothetical protein